jgi:hypothetical protein
MLKQVGRITTTTFKGLIKSNDLKGRNRGLFEIRTKSHYVMKDKNNGVFIKETVKPQQLIHSSTLFRLSVLRNEHPDYKKHGSNTSNIKNTR